MGSEPVGQGLRPAGGQPSCPGRPRPARVAKRSGAAWQAGPGAGLRGPNWRL